MSFADYLALPQDLRAEYVDGQAVVNPPPSLVHQKICQRLTFQLELALGGGAEVVAAAGWKPPGPADRLRIPDIMVLDQAPDCPLVTVPPLVEESADHLGVLNHARRTAAQTGPLSRGTGRRHVLSPETMLTEATVERPDPGLPRWPG